MEAAGNFQQFVMFLGPWKWPLIILSVIVVVLILIRFIAIMQKKEFKTAHPDRILFWGGITLSVGLLGQVSGIWMALNEIIKADDISPAILIIGFLSTFATTLFGLIVFIVAALSWWGLKHLAKE